MMDDCQELSDELHTLRQEWSMLVQDLTEYIAQLRNPLYGPVIMRSWVADQLQDILKGE